MTDYRMKIALCDDEPEALQHIAQLTREAAAQEQIRCELTLYESSRALLSAIESGAQYHLLLLDVMMNEMTGMELASALRAQGNGTSLPCATGRSW